MRRLYEQIDNWAGGVNTSANADALSMGVMPRAYNNALSAIAPGPPRALASKRKGASPALTTPLSGEPAIIGQHYFKQNDGTETHLLIGDDGSVRKRLTDGTSADIDLSAFTASPEGLPMFAAANDLLFITLDDERAKFDGTGLSNFGIDAPPSAPTVGASGAGGVIAAGTYDVLITYYNDATGTESGRSAIGTATITAGQKLDVSWGAPSDSQVTHVMVYVRSQTLGPNYYRAIAGSTPASDSNGGFPIATTAIVLDITALQFANFRQLAPGIGENQPPPDGAKSPTWHGSRMFVHDGRNTYWSGIEKPEQFNVGSDYEPINPDDGDEIVALWSEHDVLMIFKTSSTWLIRGTDPNSWEVELVSKEQGAVNQQSIVSSAGKTYWWDKTHGPLRWAGSGAPLHIGIPLIAPTVNPELLQSDILHRMVAVVDSNPARQRVLFALPELGATRNTFILPFNTLLDVWESDLWNPFDIASMASGEDADSTRWVFIGGYTGHLFQLWNATNDGVPEGAERKGAVVSSTSTTLTVTVPDDDDLPVSPAWVTDELKELFVYAISQDGLDIQRRRITANTANVLTITPAWGSNPNSTFSFVVGGIDWQVDTPWAYGEAPFHKKRYEFFFIAVSSPNSGVPVTIDMFFDNDTLNVQRAKNMTLAGAVVYDTAIYDIDRYASAVLDDERIRMSKRGKAWRARIRNINPDEELTLLKVAMDSTLLNTRS